MVYLHTHIHFGIILEVTRSENETSGLKIPRGSSHRSHRRHERDQEQQRSITQVGNSSKLAITKPEKSEARDIITSIRCWGCRLWDTIIIELSNLILRVRVFGYLTSPRNPAALLPSLRDARYH